MKTTAIGVAVGVLMCLVLAEITCRVLPVSGATKSDYYIDPRILTYAPSHTWRSSMGWDLRRPQTLSTNAHGFISTHEFKHDERAIALVGDSYVEATSLDAIDRPAAQLERALGGHRYVYAMGSAGTSLLDYAERIRYAHQHFGIRDFVVLMERNDARQALCGSGNVTSQCIDPQKLTPRTESRPKPSMLKRILRESALAQYFASQLKIRPSEILRQLRTATKLHALEETSTTTPARLTSLSEPSTRQIEVVMQTFFARAMPYVKGKLVIAVDADRRALMNGRGATDPERTRVIELAQAAGAIVIDAEPLFAKHYAESTLSLDLGPDDAHFNALGARLIADALARVLRE